MSDNQPGPPEDDLITVSFNIKVGRRWQAMLPETLECISKGPPAYIITLPVPVGRPRGEETRIMIFRANETAFYVAHASNEQGEPNFGLNYKANANDLAEHLLTLGLPANRLPQIGLSDGQAAVTEAHKTIERFRRGAKPDGSRPA